MTLEPNRQLAQSFREELWNTGNLEIADQILAPDCRIDARVPFRTDFVVGPEAMKQLLFFYQDSFSDIQMEIVDLVAEGDRVVTRWTGIGTHTGAYFPQAVGKRISTSGIDFLIIRDGLIAEGWIAWDVVGLLRALGVPLPSDADWEQIGDRADPTSKA